MRFDGNVIPHQWFQHITFANGKADLVAIMILSEIVYWYRPSVKRDADTGELLEVKKRFKADLLQRSYESFAVQFGISKRQATDAIKRLEEAQLIKRHLRTVRTNTATLSNVLFIELLHDNLSQLMTINRDTLDDSMQTVSHCNEISPTFEGEPYTKNTPKTITENTTNNKACEIIHYLNDKTYKNFRTTSSTKQLIVQRLQQGYTVDDCKRVIDEKCRQWLDNLHMNRYLRPSTLFGEKFERYVDELPPKPKPEYIGPSILDFHAENVCVLFGAVAI